MLPLGHTALRASRKGASTYQVDRYALKGERDVGWECHRGVTPECARLWVYLRDP